MLDQHLTFQSHCDFVCEKMSPAVVAMFKVRDVIPAEALGLVYFSLVHSHLTQLCGI